MKLYITGDLINLVHDYVFKNLKKSKFKEKEKTLDYFFKKKEILKKERFRIIFSKH